VRLTGIDLHQPQRFVCGHAEQAFFNHRLYPIRFTFGNKPVLGTDIRLGQYRRHRVDVAGQIVRGRSIQLQGNRSNFIELPLIVAIEILAGLPAEDGGFLARRAYQRPHVGHGRSALWA